MGAKSAPSTVCVVPADLWPWKGQRRTHMVPPADSLYLREWHPHCFPRCSGSHPLNVRTQTNSNLLPFSKTHQREISEQSVPCYSVNMPNYIGSGFSSSQGCDCDWVHNTVICHSLNFCVSWCVLQVFPDVLHVCELGLCSADAAENSELETPL